MIDNKRLFNVEQWKASSDNDRQTNEDNWWDSLREKDKGGDVGHETKWHKNDI